MYASRLTGVLVVLSAGIAFQACGDDDAETSIVESTGVTSPATSEQPAAGSDLSPGSTAASSASTLDTGPTTPQTVISELPPWSYSGDTGPESWGELAGYETCGVGVAQSPIDIAAPDEADLANPELSYSPSTFTLDNNGHTVQTVFDGENSMSIDGTTYRLLQLHYHTPSEHEIDGSSFPAEFHLVHEADDGRLAVVGVMLTEGAENPLLAASLADYPAEEGKVSSSIELDPTELLPGETTTYRYEGSLTAPPCSEGVDWLVMTEPVTASADQIAALETLLGATNRPVQPLNDRVIERDTTT